MAELLVLQLQQRQVSQPPQGGVAGEVAAAAAVVVVVVVRLPLQAQAEVWAQQLV
jgi:hypothetical protein